MIIGKKLTNVRFEPGQKADPIWHRTVDHLGSLTDLAIEAHTENRTL